MKYSKETLIMYENFFDMIKDIKTNYQNINLKGFIGFSKEHCVYAGNWNKNSIIFGCYNNEIVNKFFLYKEEKLPEFILDKLELVLSSDYTDWLNNKIEIEEFSEDYLNRIIQAKIFE